MYRRILTLLAVIATCLGATGCATITTGTTQSIAINTEPQGADCSFTRENVLVARINPTPGAASVSKSKGAIGVLCKRAEYQDVAGTIESKFQDATAGNILLGGLIGVAIDSASGAMNKYPESVTFTMIPVQFATATERDAFFERMRGTFEREYKEALDRSIVHAKMIATISCAPLSLAAGESLQRLRNAAFSPRSSHPLDGRCADFAHSASAEDFRRKLPGIVSAYCAKG